MKEISFEINRDLGEINIVIDADVYFDKVYINRSDLMEAINDEIELNEPNEYPLSKLIVPYENKAEAYDMVLEVIKYHSNKKKFNIEIKHKD